VKPNIKTSILTGLLLALIMSLGLVGNGMAAKEKTKSSKLPMAPNFQLQDINGKTVSLSDYRGKVVLVNFWATWCPPCRAEMPAMQRLNDKMAGLDFVMLAVNVEPDGEHTVPSFLQGKSYTFPILLDLGAKAQNRYGVFRFPETFIIGKDGVILNHILGAREWDDSSTVDYLSFLAKG